ncbi:MAG: FMN-binding protein [Gammaproteobacteria bacterium]|nr:FMN-binding protein [Gammaproteobacteria bacterium]
MNAPGTVTGAVLLGAGAALAAWLAGVTAQHSASRIAHNQEVQKNARIEQQLPWLTGTHWRRYTKRRHMRGRGVLLTITGPDGVYRVWSPWYAEQGYNGRIALLIALDEAFCIRALDVLSHRETPGLGDRMERRHGVWLDQFVGRCAYGAPTLHRPWLTRADGGSVDVLTGATVTSRAITAGIHAALKQTVELGR